MKLRCINVPTPDARRFAAFYEETLGAAVDEFRGGPGRIEIWFCGENGEGFCVAETQDDGYKRPEITAFQGFEFLVENADAEYERLSDLGIEIKEPPRDLPWGYRYFSIKDPDGNGIDIVQVL